MLVSNVMKLPVIATSNNKNIKKIKVLTNVKNKIVEIKKIKQKLDNFMYIIDEKCYISYNNKKDDIIFIYGDKIFNKQGLVSINSALTINNKQTSKNPFINIPKPDLQEYYMNAYNSLQSALSTYGQLVNELKKAQDELNSLLQANNNKELISVHKTYRDDYEKFELTTRELENYFRDKTNEMLKKYSDMDKCFKQEKLKLPDINLSNNRNVNKIEEKYPFNQNPYQVMSNNYVNPYSVNNNNYYNNINANQNKYRVNPYQFKGNVFPNPFEHNVCKNNNIMLKPNNIDQMPVLKNYNGYDTNKLNGFPMPNNNQINFNPVNKNPIKSKVKLKPIPNFNNLKPINHHNNLKTIDNVLEQWLYNKQKKGVPKYS